MTKLKWYQSLALYLFFGRRNKSKNTLNKNFKVFKYQSLDNQAWLLIQTDIEGVGDKWFYFHDSCLHEYYHNRGWIEFYGNGLHLGIIPADKNFKFPYYEYLESRYGEVDLEELIKELEQSNNSCHPKTVI